MGKGKAGAEEGRRERKWRGSGTSQEGRREEGAAFVPTASSFSHLGAASKLLSLSVAPHVVREES